MKILKFKNLIQEEILMENLKIGGFDPLSINDANAKYETYKNMKLYGR